MKKLAFAIIMDHAKPALWLGATCNQADCAQFSRVAYVRKSAMKADKEVDSQDIKKNNSRIFYLLAIMIPVFFSCSHGGSIRSDEMKPIIDLPKWALEDCFKQGDSFLFVGYGEGQNSSSAVRNALISSRQNALTCLFGGTIASNIVISETNLSVQYSSKTELALNYSHVNWSGYEALPGKTIVVPGNLTRIYVQYRWRSSDIDKERIRLDKLAKEIEETKALKVEVGLKENLIQEQKTRLAELDRQSRELEEMKSASDKAVQKLQKIKLVKAEKSREILNVIENLYCGITIGKMIELFREPDSAEAVATGGTQLLDHVAFSWDQYQVRVGYSYIRSKIGRWPRAGEMDSRVIDISKGAPVDVVHVAYGLTGRSYRICK